MQKAAESGVAKKPAFPPLPAQARVTKERSRIFKVEDGNGEEHVLTKIGEYFKEGNTFIAQGVVEECAFEGKRYTVIKFKVPNPRVPGKWLEFALIADDVELEPLKH